MEVVVNELTDLLQSHANRDKVLSLVSYICKLWGSTSGREGLSARLVAARSTTRALDDAAVVKT